MGGVVSLQSQCCNGASDTGLIEINEVAPEWVTPFWSDSFCFQ